MRAVIDGQPVDTIKIDGHIGEQYQGLYVYDEARDVYVNETGHIIEADVLTGAMEMRDAMDGLYNKAVKQWNF